MVENLSPFIFSIMAGCISGVFVSGVTIGVFKKTLNGSVAAVHRIDKNHDRMERKLDDHIAEENTNQANYLSRLGRIEGMLHGHLK